MKIGRIDCVSCKHGHECPYMSTDDLVHALIVDADESIHELRESAELAIGNLEARIKEVFEVSTELELGVELVRCAGYEDALECKVDSEHAKKVHLLIICLWGLAGDSRSKVGVRVPFDMFDTLTRELEVYHRYLFDGADIEE